VLAAAGYGDRDGDAEEAALCYPKGLVEPENPRHTARYP
jgi:hypothetical protein